ncbi:MAG TPA: hypothetical protein VNX21_02045 [Candidatus Thermoplasmatota archaeon]|nr:hypothetical protein [Candidatus Thermoplasmatota archaeon]
MRGILATGLFWLGILALAGVAYSFVRGATATEGLADLGWFVFGVLGLVLAGGLHGGFLLAAPRGTPRWMPGVAVATASFALVAAGLMLVQGVDPGTVRVAAFVALVALPALGGLLRAPRLLRA